VTKINCTKDYRLFQRSSKNRNTDAKKHKRLFKSMSLYGFLKSFPIVCERNASKQLIIKDGQHRLAIAESLGLPVYYVIEDVDFDIALVNSTAAKWNTKDYAQNWAARGVEDYATGLKFASEHRIPIGISFTMLAGNTNFSNISQDYYDGKFTVKDHKWANDVVSIYGPIRAMNPGLKSDRFLAACMAVCRVDAFVPKRLLKNAERCRDKLVRYSTRDAYLDMLEEVYNFGTKTLFPLRISALTAMRERNFAAQDKE
jgi:hypothetical protein